MRSIILVFSLLLVCAVAAERRLVCYWASWAIYKAGNGKFNPEDIDPNLCTHVIYAFANLNSDGTIRPLDPHCDLPSGKDGYNRVNQLRNSNPSLKTMIALGGWSDGSVNYSKMASDAGRRSAFVRNAVEYVKRYGFNGMDLDWEYPAQRGGAASDKQNFVHLLRELKEAFDQQGLILSAAVNTKPAMAKMSYDIPNVASNLHFVNMMSYDLHMGTESATAMNAALFHGSWEKGTNLVLNVNATIHNWLAQGAPAGKLNLGIPFYGQTFTLANPGNTKIGAPASGPGKPGPYTGEAGSMGYNEICEKMGSERWTVRFSDQQKVPYAFYGDQWISYDNVQSVEEKVRFIKNLGLGGAMVWSIETDDFRGICGPRYPLLNALNQVRR